MNKTATPDSLIQRIWYEDSPAYWILLPFSWLFAAIVWLRRKLYARGIFRSFTTGVPVIVVGNITVGGTGKTPVSIWLAKQLKERGMRPGIVSRGYGGSVGNTPVRVAADSDPAVVGDEAVLMAKRSECPVVVHPDRVRAVQELRHVDVAISDDGLQYYRLARQYELAVVDGIRGFGNGTLLPAGPLREPPSRLKHANRIFLNKSVMRSEGALSSLPEGMPITEFYLKGTIARQLGNGEEAPLERFAGKEVHAVAAIGNPGRFFTFLESHGMHVIEHALPDHAKLSESDLRYDDDLDVLMTEKDAVKCANMTLENCWYVPVQVQADGPLDWLDQLHDRLSVSE
jgi:tetraacyldisaccharide 4'-kinase